MSSIVACESTKEAKVNAAHIIEGDWKVQWVTTPDKDAKGDQTVNYTMNGKMNIEKGGKITISAYGYDGCIFGADTLIHSLNWELKADTILNLTNEGDKYGIPYYITSASEDKVKLQLVEDVYLFLTKE